MVITSCALRADAQPEILLCIEVGQQLAYLRTLSTLIKYHNVDSLLPDFENYVDGSQAQFMSL